MQTKEYQERWISSVKAPARSKAAQIVGKLNLRAPGVLLGRRGE